MTEAASEESSTHCGGSASRSNSEGNCRTAEAARAAATAAAKQRQTARAKGLKVSLGNFRKKLDISGPDRRNPAI